MNEVRFQLTDASKCVRVLIASEWINRSSYVTWGGGEFANGNHANISKIYSSSAPTEQFGVAATVFTHIREVKGKVTPVLY